MTRMLLEQVHDRVELLFVGSIIISTLKLLWNKQGNVQAVLACSTLIMSQTVNLD